MCTNEEELVLFLSHFYNTVITTGYHTKNYLCSIFGGPSGRPRFTNRTGNSQQEVGWATSQSRNL